MGVVGRFVAVDAVTCFSTDAEGLALGVFSFL
jgi:hypothetical protein